MNKNKLKIISLVIVVIVLFSAIPINISAAKQSTKNEIDLDFSKHAKAVYLYSLEGNRTLYCSGEEKTIAVGPVAKIMTGLIACEALSDKLEEKINITSDMLNGIWGNSMQLKAGMTVTIKDLIYGTICGGNNDAAQALALVCSSSISDFVKEMNSYAEQLGMDKTTFSTVTFR